MQFPQVAIADRLSRALTEPEAAFEMTMSGRSRIHVEAPRAGPSNLEKFLKPTYGLSGPDAVG